MPEKTEEGRRATIAPLHEMEVNGARRRLCALATFTLLAVGALATWGLRRRLPQTTRALEPSTTQRNLHLHMRSHSLSKISEQYLHLHPLRFASRYCKHHGHLIWFNTQDIRFLPFVYSLDLAFLCTVFLPRRPRYDTALNYYYYYYATLRGQKLEINTVLIRNIFLLL
jgi:hypothetical protein